MLEKKPTRSRATKKKTARKKKTAKKAKKTKVSALAALDDNEATVKPDEDRVRPVDEIDPNEVRSEIAGDDA